MDDSRNEPGLVPHEMSEAAARQINIAQSQYMPTGTASATKQKRKSNALLGVDNHISFTSDKRVSESKDNQFNIIPSSNNASAKKREKASAALIVTEDNTYAEDGEESSQKKADVNATKTERSLKSVNDDNVDDCANGSKVIKPDQMHYVALDDRH